MSSQETLLKERVLKLQAILALENGRPYSYEEAERVGRGLLNYYSNLANNELGIGLIIKPIDEYENNLNVQGK